jgi:hypothetical protein
LTGHREDFMRTFAITAILGLALAGAAAGTAPAGGVAWEKPELALAKAAATGMPICYFFTQNAAQKDGST